MLLEQPSLRGLPEEPARAEEELAGVHGLADDPVGVDHGVAVLAAEDGEDGQVGPQLLADLVRQLGQGHLPAEERAQDQVGGRGHDGGHRARSRAHHRYAMAAHAQDAGQGIRPGRAQVDDGDVARGGGRAAADHVSGTSREPLRSMLTSSPTMDRREFREMGFTR